MVLQNASTSTALTAAPVVLLTGASGYVGGQLIPRLERQGLVLRCLARDPDAMRARVAATTEIDTALPAFPPNVGTLPLLGRFNETPKGLTIGVGDLFSLPGIAPLAATDIVITSNGDVPEPTALVLSAIGLLGLVLFARKRQRCVA